MDTLERRVWGEKKPKYRVTLQIILVFTLTRPRLDLFGACKCIWKYLQWPHVNVNVKILDV